MIYFIIQKEAGIDKYVKIGLSDRPEERIKMLQTGNPHKLELWLCLPGDAELEAQIHHFFTPIKIHLEWFELSEQFVSLIEKWVHDRKITLKNDDVPEMGSGGEVQDVVEASEKTKGEVTEINTQ